MTIRSYVDGEWRDGSATADVNPANPDDVVAEVRLATTRICFELNLGEHWVPTGLHVPTRRPRGGVPARAL